MVAGLPTPRASRMYTDAQREWYKSAVDIAWNALLLEIERSGHFSDETSEAAEQYRRALKDYGIVEGWMT